MSKKLAVAMMLVAVMMSSVFVSGFALADGGNENAPLVQIESDDGGLVAIFADGRINGLDMTESVAVYYDYEVEYYSEDGETLARNVVSAIEAWVVNDGASAGQLALYVPIADVEAAISGGVDATIASANGVTLGYSASGWLWITGPRNYSFTWEL